jgi:hypothetical protein
MGMDDEIARLLWAMRNRDEHMDGCKNGCEAKDAKFCTAGRILDRQVTEALRHTVIIPQGLPSYYSLPDYPSE